MRTFLVSMQNTQHILFIGIVWPEPNSSAAGSRTLQLIEQFQQRGWKVTFACAARETEFMCDLSLLNIPTVKIELNNESFDRFVKELNPTMVIFDRFLTEEQFGWRVAEHCPNAVRIIDTIDLHCLRDARQQALKDGVDFSADYLFSNSSRREIASIMRSDLSIMISRVEIEILKNYFKVEECFLHYTPFLLDPILPSLIDEWKGFDEREHFMSIGNFLHEPNWNAVLYLKENIWPLIRRQLPKAQMHIYGAYTPVKAENLHNEKEGFLIMGRAVDAKEVMGNARICLAPLRFGAGMKGKLIDAMESGTPSVTTEIGAESMHDNLAWNGVIANTPNEIASAAVNLYTNPIAWKQAQLNGIELISKCYDKKKHGELLILKMQEIQSQLVAHRKSNFIGSMLMHHTLNSTKYMSKWIEEKNK